MIFFYQFDVDEGSIFPQLIASSFSDEPIFALPFRLLQILEDIDALLQKWRCLLG